MLAKSIVLFPAHCVKRYERNFCVKVHSMLHLRCKNDAFTAPVTALSVYRYILDCDTSTKICQFYGRIMNVPNAEWAVGSWGKGGGACMVVRTAAKKRVKMVGNCTKIDQKLVCRRMRGGGLNSGQPPD